MQSYGLNPLHCQPCPKMQAAARGEPLIFRGSAASLWRAREKWTWEYLREHLPATLTGIKTTPRKAPVTPFFYNHAAPFSAVADLSEEYTSKAYIRVNMSKAEYLDTVNARSA